MFNDTIAKYKRTWRKIQSYSKTWKYKRPNKATNNTKDAWVKEKTTELQALRKNVDDNYLKLRDLKEDHKTRLVKINSHKWWTWSLGFW